jgi:hypothetical protein
LSVSAGRRRGAWETHWQECYDYALPQRDGAVGPNAPGERKTDKLFDGTAADAVDQLAASLLSELTPPWSRWFGLAPGPAASDQERAELGPILEHAEAVRGPCAGRLALAEVDAVLAGVIWPEVTA